MAEAQQKKKEPTLVLHNTVRRRHTRLKRMQAAGRHRFKQFVGEVRVTRNRPRPVSQSFIEDNLEQLKGMVEAGTMEVRTEGGQLVDLSTMKSEAPPKTKKMPEPVKAVEKLQEEPPPLSAAPPPMIADAGVPEGDAPKDDEPLKYSPPKKTRKKRSSSK